MTHSILVAENDVACRNRLDGFFQRHGFRTYTTSCGTEAIEIVQKVPIEMGVLDMFLPDASAVEILGVMRRLRGAVPTVIIVENDSKETRMKALSAGAYTVIRKSFLDIVIEQTIRDMMRKFFGEIANPEESF
jgi:DNA-binding response OmpR family regulator